MSPQLLLSPRVGLLKEESRSTNKCYISIESNDRSVDYAENVTVLLGEDAKPITVHKNILCQSSSFFQKGCSGRWRSSNDRPFTLADHEESNFLIYVHWLYTGELDLEKENNGNNFAPRRRCRRRYEYCETATQDETIPASSPLRRPCRNCVKLASKLCRANICIACLHQTLVITVNALCVLYFTYIALSRHEY